MFQTATHFFTYLILYQLHTLNWLISCFETFSPSFWKKKMKNQLHSRFPYLETVILLNFVWISFLLSYLLCITSKGKTFLLRCYSPTEIFTNDRKCHQKLNSKIRKMSTPIADCIGPLYEKFDLDAIHTDVLSIESCYSTEPPTNHLEAPSRQRLSPIFLIVAESTEDSTQGWNCKCPSAIFVSTEWIRKRRTASLLMFERHCEKTMEV